MPCNKRKGSCFRALSKSISVLSSTIGARGERSEARNLPSSLAPRSSPLTTASKKPSNRSDRCLAVSSSSLLESARLTLMTDVPKSSATCRRTLVLPEPVSPTNNTKRCYRSSADCMDRFILSCIGSAMIAIYCLVSGLSNNLSAAPPERTHASTSSCLNIQRRPTR